MNSLSSVRDLIAESSGGVANEIGGVGPTANKDALGRAPSQDPAELVSPSSGAGFSSELDAFMDAIGEQESNGRYGAIGPQTEYGHARGKYQILQSNWNAWAKEAGIPGADWRDPEAQDRVARHKMAQYFRQFGSWAAVAVAWFAGPGRAATYMTNPGAVANLSDGGMHVAGYVQKMEDGMSKRLGEVAPKPGGSPVQSGPSTSWTPDSIGEFGKQLASQFGLQVTSHGRTRAQNAAVGGAENSYHIGGYALDLGGSTDQMMAAAEYLRQFSTTNGGPLVEILDPVNQPHGTGPHLHIAFDRSSSAPVRMPGQGATMRTSDVYPVQGRAQVQKQGAAALAATLRSSFDAQSLFGGTF